ncbi:hypothetical protein [Streptomyces sp. NPDC001508]|uniref:hypothetical protein n=1 Tax=Streptomyces sp. NPDC001508 TaxID=3154656 RepID=UPI003331315A
MQIRASVGLLPQDRKAEGVVRGLSVREDIALAALPALSRLGPVDTTVADRCPGDLDPSPMDPAMTGRPAVPPGGGSPGADTAASGGGVSRVRHMGGLPYPPRRAVNARPRQGCEVS